jgi:hypothetical protein
MVFFVLLFCTKCVLTLLLFIFFHQNIENLEGQIADALTDRNKAAETISKLQVRLLLFMVSYLFNSVSEFKEKLHIMSYDLVFFYLHILHVITHHSKGSHLA